MSSTSTSSTSSPAFGSTLAAEAVASFGAVAGALTRTATDYWGRRWADALAGTAGPVDVAIDVAIDALEWTTELNRRQRPRWSTANTVVAQWPVARLRNFSVSGTAQAEHPTLLLPPQAGHDSCIVDYAPEQSQVRTALAAGLTRVYALDWKPATAATKDAAIEDYLVVLEDAVDLLGGSVDLVGDCQGGWLAVIYAALHPEKVHSLTIAGAPVDFHAGEPLIHDWVRLLTPGDELAFYRGIVALNGGLLPGEFLLEGFKALQPHAEFERRLGLLAVLRDPVALDRYRRFEDWFTWTQPLPGVFYLWIVQRLFQRNELVAGTLTAGGRRVDLARITCPLFLLAGASDHITPPPQVFALADHAGTARERVVRRTAPGGHLGLFMGHQALREHWAPLFAEIAALPA